MVKTNFKENNEELKGDSLSSSIEDNDAIVDDNIVIDETTLPDAIRAIINGLFKENPLKMAKINSENAKGMHAALALNNFLEEYYGVRIKAYDDLMLDIMTRNVSVDALGIAALIEALGKINVSFQNAPESKFTQMLPNMHKK